MTILYDFGMLMLLSLIVIIFIIIVIVTNICVIVYQQQWFLISYLATSLYKLSNKINICYIYPAKWVYFPTYILILQRKFEPLDSRLQIRASRGAPPTALQWIRPHKRFVRSSDSPSQVTQSSNPVTFTNPNEPKWSIIVRSVAKTLEEILLVNFRSVHNLHSLGLGQGIEAGGGGAVHDLDHLVHCAVIIHLYRGVVLDVLKIRLPN